MSRDQLGEDLASRAPCKKMIAAIQGLVVAVKIGSNISSLQAQRRLGDASSLLSRTYERLSSGARINRASDDAAGLAVSSDLGVKSRIFGQAIRNANDGISMTNIADATIEALTQIAMREKELAAQSSNGTYSAKQREAIDNEAQALAKEYFRVSRSAQFNGQRLFDGSMSDGLRLQLGIGVEGGIKVELAGELGTGDLEVTEHMTAENHFTFSAALGDLNCDGVLDLVTTGQSRGGERTSTVRLGRGDGTFGSAASITEEAADGRNCAVRLGDINGDGLLDILVTGYDYYGESSLITRLGKGDGTFGEKTTYTLADGYTQNLILGDINNDGVLDLVTGGDSSTVLLNQGSGTFSTESFAMAVPRALADVNEDGALDLVAADRVYLGAGDGTFSAIITLASGGSYLSRNTAVGDLNSDGLTDIVSGGNALLGQGDGSFTLASTFEETTCLALSDLNGDAVLDLAAGVRGPNNEGYAMVRLGRGDGTFTESHTFLVFDLVGWSDSISELVTGDLNGDGVADVLTAQYYNPDYSYYEGHTTVLLGKTRDGISSLEPFSLKTKADALYALSIFDKTLNNLASIRGTIGANQSRISTALGGIQSSRENYIAAGSRITDADVAQESAALVLTQILQQAASAVLAQANQSPALALTLLHA